VQLISFADKYLCSVILIYKKGLNIVKLDITSVKQHKTKHQNPVDLKGMAPAAAKFCPRNDLFPPKNGTTWQLPPLCITIEIPKLCVSNRKGVCSIAKVTRVKTLQMSFA